MKFRCRMIDVGPMRDLMNITTILSRMSKQCTVRLTPAELCFSVGDGRMPVVWVEMSQRHFFREYTMTGVSDEQNEIYLECEALMLAKSLSTLRTNAKSVKMKLTNKQQPCLTIEIELPSLSVESRQCVHDVPVRVVPRKEWSEHQAPNIPEFHISIDLPQLKHIRSVVERMKNISPQLIISAENCGKLVLKVDTDRASVATFFQSLRVWQSSQAEQDDPVSVTVDVKKFSAFLSWDVLHPECVKCNVLHERMVNLFCSMDEYLKIYYFIPALAM